MERERMRQILRSSPNSETMRGECIEYLQSLDLLDIIFALECIIAMNNSILS